MFARERAADTRDLLADERDRQAERRDAAASKRERLADEREALANARELEADLREAAATEREQLADERDRAFKERGRRLSAAGEGLEQQMAETIERSRVLLALGGERLDPQEARMKRQRAHRQRQQAEVSRAAAESERKLTGWLPDPGPLAERGKVLRRRVLASMRALASNEEEAARIFQDLAASNPNRRAEYLDQAEHARTSALSAREVLARFSA